MKKYIIGLFSVLLFALSSYGQVIPKPNPTAVGIGYKRLLADSTLFIPTGSTQPRLGANNINRRSAIFADTVNKKLWVFYPNDSTWKESGVTTINWDSVFNKPTYFKTKYDSSTDVRDSIQARLAIRDTAAMLFSYYNKTAIDARLNLKVNISDTAAMLLPYAKAFTVVKYSDTAAMLAPYLRAGVLDGYVPNTRMLTINGIAQSLSADRTWSIAPGGLSGQILSKNSDTDYDYTWIDNFADWTSTVKEYVKAGQDITKGQAVYVSSSDGTNIIVSKASNTTEATSSKVIGLLAQTLATNAKGYVITEGLLSGLNTASATTGDPVWLGVDGNLIYGLVNKPYAPAHLVYIGVVVRANSSNGEIFIQPQNGFEMDELHNVSARNPLNNDILAYNTSTSLWEKNTIGGVLGYTPANNSLVVKYTDTASILSPYSRDYNTVHKSGVETITGLKFFDADAAFYKTVTFNSTVFSYGNLALSHTAPLLSYGPDFTTMVGVADGIKFGLPSTATTQFTFPAMVGANFTFPAASGTVALTSQIPSLSGYVQGSGTTNYISKFTGSGTIGNSALQDDGTNIGLGAAPTGYYNTTVKLGTGSNSTGIAFTQSNSLKNEIYSFNNDLYINSISGNINLATQSSTRAVLNNAGRFLVGGATDDGSNLLQVGGGGRFTGALSGTSATFTTNQNGSTWVKVSNNDAGSGAAAGFLMANNGGDLGAISLLSSTNSPSNALFIRTLSTNSLVLGANSAANLTIANGGAATFSSSVTVGGFVKGQYLNVTSGTTAGYLIKSGDWQGDASTDLSIAAESANLRFYTNGSATERMRITSGGNLLVGTTTDNGAKLQVSGGGTFSNTLTAAGLMGAFNTSTDGGVSINGADGAYGLIQASNAANSSARQLVINRYGGIVTIGTTADQGGKLQVAGDIRSFGAASAFYFQDQAGSALRGWYSSGAEVRLFVEGSGTVGYFSTTTGIYTPLSDSTKKKDFESSTIGLNAIMNLKPTLFRMKTDNESTPKTLGFVAQEVKPFIPQAYVESGDGKDKFIGLQDRPIIAALVKAVQELKAEKDALEARLKLIEQKLNIQ